MSGINRSFEAAEPVLVAATRDRVLSLYREGHHVYQSANIGPSALLFGQARELADSIDDRAMAACARFWEGAALHGTGKLHEALATFAQAPASGEGQEGDRWAYMALTRYVLIAVDLPVSLELIERALDEAWRCYAETGSGKRRSRLLLVRARLAMARGRHREALADAQEGLERRKRETLGFSLWTHVRTLVDICFRLGDLELARRYVEEWEVLDTDYVGTKRICLAAARSMILRLERRTHEALDWARRAEHEGRLTDDLPSRFWVLKALIRALLCTEDPGPARDPLVDLLRLRSSAVGDIRYETRLLLADYHLASARRLAGLPPVDLELSGEVEALGSRTNNETVVRGLHRARRLYAVALRTGRAIDRLLSCDIRTREIEQRVRLADAISGGSDCCEGAV